MGRFNDKVVLITGAGRGQGASHAINFAKEGANLIICDLPKPPKEAAYELGNLKELEDVAEKCRKSGSRVVAVGCDITSDAQVKAMVDAGIKEFGKIDIVINNAGWGKLGLIHELSEEAMVGQVNVNLLGPMRICRHVLPYMIERKSGCILNVSSLGTRALGNFGAYSAAKAGITYLTNELAVEYGKYNIRANEVIPGTVATPMISGLGSTMTPDEAVKVFSENSNILPLIIYPQSISNAMMYLAADLVITGAHLAVDAGAFVKK